MASGFEGSVAALPGGTDPRLDDAFWCEVPATDERAAAVLVGVVHDHPASVHRAEAVVDALDPDVLALELPAVSLPYFERRAGRATGDASASTGERAVDADARAATDGGTEVARDDEMRAAIAAADESQVVAVDTFDWGFFLRFARRARETSASFETVRSALGDVRRIAGHALRVRFGDADGRAPGDATPHADLAVASPSEQAADERTQVERSRSLLGAFERPAADVLLDRTRERQMAANIDASRRDGTVVAVVGMHHLERIARSLD